MILSCYTGDLEAFTDRFSYYSQDRFNCASVFCTILHLSFPKRCMKRRFHTRWLAITHLSDYYPTPEPRYAVRKALTKICTSSLSPPLWSRGWQRRSYRCKHWLSDEKGARFEVWRCCERSMEACYWTMRRYRRRKRYNGLADKRLPVGRYLSCLRRRLGNYLGGVNEPWKRTGA